jgi:16S rRNA (guanine(1405)-N(7))-methyltransferase
MMEIGPLVDLVKDKQELRGIDPAFVEKHVLDYIRQHDEFVDKYEQARDVDQFTRSKEYDAMLKEVRSLLRDVYGMFIMDDYDDMEDALDALREDQSLANHCSLLGMHRSSKERLPFYEKIYDQLFDITGQPDSVMDLACGLNPFSYPFIPGDPAYYASDISPDLIDYINTYFEMRSIEGQAFVFDLMEFRPNAMTAFAHVDVCFLFKALDTLETLNWGYSEYLIEHLPADYIVVSFPRQSLGGKQIADDKREWFEDMVDGYESFSVPNELFYVVETST